MPGSSKAKHPQGWDIEFFEDKHKYVSYINGEEITYISGTQFLHSFFPPFDPNGEIAKRCAAKEGVTVEEIKERWAQSGREALDMAGCSAYDLILMDQRMPGMDGTETLHHLRGQKDGINRHTPVICMTADAIIGAKERYTGEGFTDYLSKPVNGEMLEKMLIRYLPADKVEIQARTSAAAAEEGRSRSPGCRPLAARSGRTAFRGQRTRRKKSWRKGT